MKSILFFPDLTELLNQKVSKKIAPHLFLFCHYQPDQVRVFSFDARFCQGVMNLYKLVVDASIIGMLYKIAKPNKIVFDQKKLDGHIKTISMLRTVLGHNISEQNGTSDLQKQYESWLKQATGKTVIQNAEDYEPAVKILEQMGADICRILDQFINQAALRPERKEVAASWEETIFAFYKKSPGQKIFLGQMKDAYLSRCYAGSINIQKNRLKRKLACWFQSYYCQKQEEQIRNLHKILDVYGAKLDKNVCRQIQVEAEEEEHRLEEIKRKVASKLGVISTDYLTPYQYQEYYFLEMNQKLQDALLRMKKSGKGSMLPESLMQELIEKEFAEIHSEDF